MEKTQNCGFWWQTWIMVYHVLLLKRRKIRQTVAEFVVPIAVMMIIPLIAALLRAFPQPSPKVIQKFDPVSLNSLPPAFPFVLGPRILDLHGVYAAPNTEETRQLTKRTAACFSNLINSAQKGPINAEKFNLSISMFSSGKAIDANVSFLNTSGTVGLVFDESDLNKFEIRMNPLFWLPQPFSGDITNIKCSQARNPFNFQQLQREYMTCLASRYISTGFVLFQQCVTSSLLEADSSSEEFLQPNVTVRIMPRPPSDPSAAGGFTENMASILPVFAWSFVAVFLAMNLVLEKEAKLKDSLRMIGLRLPAYWLSWFLVYFVIFIIDITIVIILLRTVGASVNSDLSQTNVIILFITLIIASLWFLMFAMALVPFFSRSLSVFAATFAIAVVILVLHMVLRNINASADIYYYLSIFFGNFNFVTAIHRLIIIQYRTGDFTWQDITVNPDNVMPLYESWLWMILNTTILALLAFYFDMTLTGQFGTREHPLFFIKKSYWRRNCGCFEGEIDDDYEDYESDETVCDGSVVESVPPEVAAKKAVHTRNLTKVFKRGSTKTKAVNNLSMEIYAGDITAVLGHNGAGKTTTINMLSGLLAPTSGNATIFGKSIRRYEEMQDIRQSLGVCPQHDLIWENLSVKENMIINALMRNVSWTNCESEIDALLHELELYEKKYEIAKTLSGGQKRRLCVAMALIGDPRMVILDEPTSGVDPSSRRKLWDILKSRRRDDRVILLTTHSMYEADVLSDRKIIISGGKLKCAGSSLFLKNKFGGGYHINAAMDKEVDFDRFEYLVNELKLSLEGILGNVKISSKFSDTREISFTVSKDEVSKIPAVLEYLEGEEGQLLGVKNVSIALSTLEEVFINLTEESSKERSYNVSETTSLSTDVSLQVPSVAPKQLADYDNLGFEKSNSMININRHLTDSRKLFKSKNISSARLWFLKLFALLKIRYLIAFREWTQFIWRLLPPLILIALAGTNADISTSNSNSIVYYKDLANYINPAAPLLVRNNTGESLDKFLGFLSQATTAWEMYDGTYDELINHTKQAFLGIEVNALTKGESPLDWTVWYNESLIPGLGLAFDLMDNIFYESVMLERKLDPKTNIRTTYKTLPLPVSSNIGILTLLFPFWFFWLAVVWPIVFLPADVVKEKELGAKSIIRLSGADVVLYWLSFYIFHLTYYFVLAICMVITIAISTPVLFESAISVLMAIFVSFLNVPVILLMSYNLSFLFRKTTMIIIFQLVLFFVTSFIISIVLIVLYFLDQEAAVDMHQILSFIYPPYGFYGYLNNYGVIRSYERGNKTVFSIDEYLDWDNHMLPCILGNIIQLILFIFILLTIDGNYIKKRFKKFLLLFRNGKKATIEEPFVNFAHSALIDDDVVEEKLKTQWNVQNLLTHEGGTRTTSPDMNIERANEPEKNAVLLIHQLKKKYSGASKMAVDGVSFRVLQGEVFGLLGPNGAGKTTTLSTVVGEHSPSSGKMFIGPYDTSTSATKARKQLGYCPQFDALWESITTDEHIEFYAKLRNYSDPVSFSLLQDISSVLGLKEHKNKLSSQLSGGTKRKLSFLLSITGNDLTVLLDEPSTGMDPVSMRHFWSVIREYFSVRSNGTLDSVTGAVLTTHSMEEAEALCDRVGIMVNGQLRCIGSTQHLRNKFGSGYTLEMKLVDSSEHVRERGKKLVTQHFTKAKLNQVDSIYDRLHFEIPQDEVKPLYKTFSLLEKWRNSNQGDEQLITEYLISQCTLERVFLRFAREQETFDAT